MFQLHVSGLQMLSKCGVQFERRYMLGEKTPSSVVAAIGTAVDRSVTANLGHKIETQQLLPFSTVQDIAHDSIIKEWEQGVEVTGEDQDDGLAESKGQAVDAAVALAGLHHSSAAPGISPTHVQRPWTLYIEEMNFQLAGTIDVQEGLRSIRDTKTSGKSPARDLAFQSLQLTTYALAVKAHDGKLPESVGLDYLVRTPKRHDLKLVQLTSERGEKDMTHLLERVATAKRIIDSGLFTPAPLDAWWCSKKFCPYWHDCRYARRPVSFDVKGELHGNSASSAA